LGEFIQHLVKKAPSGNPIIAADMSATSGASPGPPSSLAGEAATSVKIETTVISLSASHVNDLDSDISELYANTKDADVKDLIMKEKLDEQKEDLMMESTLLCPTKT
jgi:hypothetical protein